MEPSTVPADPVPPQPARRWRSAVLGTAALVLLVAGLVVWRIATQEQKREALPAASAVDEVFTELPGQLSPPARVADLPRDRGVGQAALIYHLEADARSYDPAVGFEQKDIYLVTRSGEHFRLGQTPKDTGPLNLSLSPDGRWLFSQQDGRGRVRDLSGVAEYEIPAGFYPHLWSTDARSLLLAKKSADGWAFSKMVLPGGGVYPLDVQIHGTEREVAFIAGRELAVYEPSVKLVGASGVSGKLDVTVVEVTTGAKRKLPVVLPGQLRPGEIAGGMFSFWHSGGSPPSIWTEIGRPDLLPDDSPEGVPFVPAVAMVGVDAASGSAMARIEVGPMIKGNVQTCEGVVADGVVLNRLTTNMTELTVLDPHRNVNRVVTTIPALAHVLIPGAMV